MRNLKIKKVIIVQAKNYGDLLLSTCVENVLRAIFPDVRVIWVVRDGAQPIVACLPSTESVFSRTFNVFGLFALAYKIKSHFRTVDLFLDLHGSRHAGLLSYLIRATHSVRIQGARQAFYGSKTNKKDVRPLICDRSTIEKNLDCLRSIGLEIPQSTRNPSIEGFATSNVLERLRLSRNQYLMVHPGARWMFKTLTPNQWVGIIGYLANRFSLPIIVSGDGSESEQSLCRSIIERCSSSLKISNVCGQLTMADLTSLIESAKFFVGVDSFASHIANAASTPGVVFFGPTKDRVWGPPDGSSVDLIISDRHPCRPCDGDGCDGSKVSDCLVSLTAEEIHERLERSILKVLN